MTARRRRVAAVAVAVVAGVALLAGARPLGQRIKSLYMAGGGAETCFAAGVRYCLAGQSRSGKIDFQAVTDYWTATPKTDADGVPYREGAKGRYRNVSSVALSLYGPRLFDIASTCRGYAETPAMRANREWLLANVVPLKNGAVTWRYDYDTNVDDVLLFSPFASAFSQAAVIERLLLLACATGDAAYRDLARRAARAFDLPVTEGGLRSEDPDFVWFQEVPLPDRHNPYILNAHLYAIYALGLMQAEFPDDGFAALAARGIAALERALPAIDDGAWNRYGLRPAYGGFGLVVQAPDAVLKGVVLSYAGGRSSLDFGSGERSPFANAVRGNFAPAPGGIRATGDLLLRFVLPAGREFSAGLLALPLTMAVRAACCGPAPALSTPGMRPGLSESFALPLVRRERQGDDEVFTFESGLQDAGWWPVPVEYLPTHADLMVQIGAQVGSGALYLSGLRWQGFYRRFEEDRAVAAAETKLVRPRFAFTPDVDLGARLLDRFGRRHPAEIGEAEIAEALDAIYPAAAGLICRGSETDGPCEARRRAEEALALRPRR